MFQNINEDTIEFDSKNTSENKNKINILANIFTKDNIVLYFVSFMLSFVGLGGEFSIFSISMLAACISSEIPVLGIIVFSLIGNFIKFGVGGLLGYFITSLVMIAGVFIFKPRYNEQERNEKIKIGKNIFITILLIQVFKFMVSGFTIYDALSSITLAMIALVFYKIFVNSIVVLKEFYKKRAFSVEEVIGASLLLAISVETSPLTGNTSFSFIQLTICLSDENLTTSSSVFFKEINSLSTLLLTANSPTFKSAGFGILFNTLL